MHQLDRFIISGNEYHIGLLKKFLNDLEQSPKQWYKMFDTFMISNDYCRSEYDNFII